MSIAGKKGRPIGLPKTGGRRPGTANKSTAILRDELVQLRFSPVRALVSIAEKSKTSDELKVQICSILLPYLYPKRKPVEDSTERGVILKPTTIIEDSQQQEDCSHADQQNDPET